MEINIEKQIPVWNKINLTVKEASEYSNIGINTLYELLTDDCPFLLKVGNKKLIKRKTFEDYINKVKYI